MNINNVHKTSHQYQGKIDGKTFVVPHGKLDIYSDKYYKAHSDETITSREHVAKHNPDFSKEEIDAVHAHIKKIHGKQLEEAVKRTKKEPNPYKVGDKVKLHPEALKHHAQSVPAHAGYTREGFAWRKHLDELHGHVGEVTHTFDSGETNVKFHNGTIGIHHKSLVKHDESVKESTQIDEGRPMVGDVFHRHQTLIAKKTLRMHDAAVGVMGGMNKEEARAHLRKMGWTVKQVHDHEHSLNEDSMDSTDQLREEQEHGFVGFDHKGQRHEVLAPSLYAAITKIREKAKTPKSQHHKVHAALAELDGPEGRKQITHTPMDEQFELNEAFKKHMTASGGVDHKKVDTQYKRNESQNRHMANVVLLAHHYGSSDDVAMAEKHLSDGKKAGHNIHHRENSDLHLDLIKKRDEARKLTEEKKFDIYHKGEYHVSTTQSKTAKEAKEKYLKAYPKHSALDVKVQLSEESQLNELHQSDYSWHHELQSSSPTLHGHPFHHSSDPELRTLHTFHSEQAKKKIRTDPHAAKRHQRHADDAKAIIDQREKTMKEQNILTTIKEVISEALYSRKHFRQIADVISKHPDEKKRKEMATHHAEIFSKSNPRFDHKRFFAAAGVKDEDK